MGADYPILLSLRVDELAGKEGIELEDAKKNCQALCTLCGLYWTNHRWIRVGHFWDDISRPYVEYGYNMPYVAAIKRQFPV